MEEILTVVDRLVQNFKLNLDKDKEMLSQMPGGMLENFQKVVAEYDAEPDKNKCVTKLIEHGLEYLENTSSMQIRGSITLAGIFLKHGKFLNAEQICEDLETGYSILLTLREEDDTDDGH